MELDLSWVLWALPVAFVAGWLASRFDIRQWRIETRSAPRSYFKGLNYLLNEQQDQAIDAFIEAVQNDPDTSELHFALGNLFRRRGEYERAVRVHEHLLSRGDLSQLDRQRRAPPGRKRRAGPHHRGRRHRVRIGRHAVHLGLFGLYHGRILPRPRRRRTDRV